MGLFDDKKYDNMDWISQAVEPIESKTAVLLTQLPDEIVFTFDNYQELIRGGYTTVNNEQIISKLIKEVNGKVDWQEANLLTKCFEFQLSDEVILDFEQQKIIGDIRLVKKKKTLEEKELQGLMGRKGKDYIDVYTNNQYAYAQEIADLLGCDADVMKSRSVRTKVFGIRHKYRQIMNENKWNLKDVDLADKVGFWIACYCQTGNLAALKNLTKLKVMTHKGLPIYSIEEEK